MTREELIEERKDMTNDEVIKAVMLKMAENYHDMYAELRTEYREGKREGWDEEALHDMATDMHDLVTKEILLRELRETLDERCSCYKNGIDFA
jgi:translation initiation factor 2 alpha subunit (eIF-2alpha)